HHRRRCLARGGADPVHRRLANHHRPGRWRRTGPVLGNHRRAFARMGYRRGRRHGLRRRLDVLALDAARRRQGPRLERPSPRSRRKASPGRSPGRKKMSNSNSLIRLNNGVEMPALGLGVFQSRPAETTGAGREAIAAGYRLIDTAAVYRNETQVGEAIAQSGVDRGEIFVTTKAWISDYGFDQTLHAFDRSMRKLGLEQLDLYLLHWPVHNDIERTLESWKALERLLAEGRTRAIGVSNFSPAHLDRLMARAAVVPALNQVELHPFFAQKALVDAHQRLGIVTQAWSPIGGVTRYRAKE